MGTYASNTDVSPDRSRAEIERTLIRYGATGFSYGWEGQRAMVAFQASNRFVRFLVQMPDRNAREYTHTEGRGQKRSERQAFAAWEQACKQRWRALALVIKAKLEAVDSGITTFENEFLANIVLPNNQTAGEWVAPAIERAYVKGVMPRMLPMLPAPGTEIIDNDGA